MRKMARVSSSGDGSFDTFKETSARGFLYRVTTLEGLGSPVLFLTPSHHPRDSRSIALPNEGSSYGTLLLPFQGDFLSVRQKDGKSNPLW